MRVCVVAYLFHKSITYHISGSWLNFLNGCHFLYLLKPAIYEESRYIVHSHYGRGKFAAPAYHWNLPLSFSIESGCALIRSALKCICTSLEAKQVDKVV